MVCISGRNCGMMSGKSLDSRFWKKKDFKVTGSNLVLSKVEGSLKAIYNRWFIVLDDNYK